MANTTVKRLACLLLAMLLLPLGGCRRPIVIPASSDPSRVIYAADHEMTDLSVVNPFMGFAVDAASKKAAEQHSLVYIDVTFRELQPDSPDQYAFDEIDESNHVDDWKAQGKHAVLRFVCDDSSDTPHRDIPDWLYDLTGDGSVYDTSYGKGYSPNYNNELFLYYHKQALAALADHFSDSFVSFVELGSLGHWGEWHVKHEDGIIPMPEEAVREQYISHYTDSFPTKKLLMRRPFKGARDHTLGLYNDMAGDADSTEQWLGWISDGGDYTQTGEKNVLYAMPDYWKTSPCGGEMTSSHPMEYLCGTGLSETLQLLQKSHTTFIGPNCPVSSSDRYDGEPYQSAVKEIIRSIGYRIGITHVEVKTTAESGKYLLSLDWENGGVAPLYFDLPVQLLLRKNGRLQLLAEVDIRLSDLLPGTACHTETAVSLDTGAQADVVLAIIDPMTGQPCIRTVSDQDAEHNETLLFQTGPGFEN